MINPMPSPNAPRSRERYIAAVALVVLASGAISAHLSAAPSRRALPVSVPQGVVQLTEGAYQYTFHLVTGTEALFNLEKDPRALRNLAKEQPERVARLRLRLLDDMKVGSLEDLRSSEQDTIDRLKALGYL